MSPVSDRRREQTRVASGRDDSRKQDSPNSVTFGIAAKHRDVVRWASARSARHAGRYSSRTVAVTCCNDDKSRKPLPERWTVTTTIAAGGQPAAVIERLAARSQDVGARAATPSRVFRHRGSASAGAQMFRPTVSALRRPLNRAACWGWPVARPDRRLWRRRPGPLFGRFASGTSIPSGGAAYRYLFRRL